jgi:hypothetical protein
MHETMATDKQTLAAELRQQESTLDAACRRRLGISVRTYKIIKALTQLIGAAGGVYALVWTPADPVTVYALLALIIVGPEAFETFLTNLTE